MTRRSLGFIFLGLGLASLAGGLLSFFSGIFTVAETFIPVTRITSPGEVTFRIDDAGVYTLWRDRNVQAGSHAAAHREVLPANLSFSLIRISDQQEFAWNPIPANMHSAISTPDHESFGVGTFEPDRGGAYILKVASAGEASHAFSLTKGNFNRTITQFGLGVILTCLLGFFGVVFFALGVVFVLMKPYASSSPLTPPAA